MLFVANRNSLSAQRLDHFLSLVRRHDWILFALEKGDRLGQPRGVEQRRSSAVLCLLFRIFPDQPILVTRLELVSVTGQRRKIADSVVAGASRKKYLRNVGATKDVNPPALPLLMTVRRLSALPMVARCFASVVEERLRCAAGDHNGLGLQRTVLSQLGQIEDGAGPGH
jgi:hypothetical protein